MSTIIRTSIECSDKALAGNEHVCTGTKYTVLGWEDVSDSGMLMKDYVATFADPGQYILKVCGVVEEEEQFEERNLPFKAGERYAHEDGNRQEVWLIVYAVEEGFLAQHGNDGPNYDHQFTFFSKSGKSKHFTLIPKKERISIGKRKVLKPL